jgi:hypothetical protein
MLSDVADALTVKSNAVMSSVTTAEVLGAKLPVGLSAAVTWWVPTVSVDVLKAATPATSVRSAQDAGLIGESDGAGRGLIGNVRNCSRRHRNALACSCWVGRDVEADHGGDGGHDLVDRVGGAGVVVGGAAVGRGDGMVSGEQSGGAEDGYPVGPG